MPYVQRLEGKIIGIFSNPQEGYAEEYIPDNSAELQPTDEDRKSDIKARIDTIEREQIMPRKTREIQIQVMEYFAQTQGLTKQQLYAANPAYKGMVDINKEIIALRAQL